MSEFPIVGFLLIFLVVGAGFILINLLVGKLFRPVRPHEEKATIYECGEPTIGSAWVQFDLRYYVIALLFVIFDVEVAFFFPWAVVFGKANAVSKVEEVPAVGSAEEANLLANLKALDAGFPENGIAPIQGAGTEAEKRAVRDKKVKGYTKAAGSIATVAFFDILIFFGILLVGFAYLWKRGDLAWVRAVEQGPPTLRAPPGAQTQEKATV